KTAWHDQQVVVGERFAHAVWQQPQAAIVGDWVGPGAMLPLKIWHEIHRPKPRDRIINPDQVEGGQAVEKDKGGAHVREFSSVKAFGREYKWGRWLSTVL